MSQELVAQLNQALASISARLDALERSQAGASKPVVTINVGENSSVSVEPTSERMGFKP